MRILVIVMLTITPYLIQGQHNNEFLDFLDKEIDKLQTTIAGLETENRTLEKEVDALKSNLTATRRSNDRKLITALEELYASNFKLQKKEDQLNLLENQLDLLKNNMTGLESENRLLRNRITQLDQQVKGQAKDLKKLNAKNLEYERSLTDSLEAFGKRELEYKAKISAYKDVIYNKKRNNYWATGAGFGSNYSGLGISLQSRFGNRLGFGVHFGGGYWFSSPSIDAELILLNGGIKIYAEEYFVDFTYNRTIKHILGDKYQNLFSAGIGRNWNIRYFLLINTGVGLVYSNDVVENDLLLSIDLGVYYKF
jgi:chaperonin cofactor prefoldin